MIKRLVFALAPASILTMALAAGAQQTQDDADRERTLVTHGYLPGY